MAPKAVLDASLLGEMSKHVEKLTTSGRPILDEDIMKQFKKICKKSDAYVTHAFHLILTQLEQSHSEIRLSAFQMMNELFLRSHCIREQILNDFQYIMELTIGLDPENPLPPPRSVADTLKATTLQSIQQWQDKFGNDYKKLNLGYIFLKQCKKVAFDDMRARTQAERRVAEEKQKKQEILNQKKISNLLTEMQDMSSDIEGCLTEIENCLCLVMPDLDSFFINGLESPMPEIEMNANDLFSSPVTNSIESNSQSQGEDTNDNNLKVKSDSHKRRKSEISRQRISSDLVMNESNTEKKKGISSCESSNTADKKKSSQGAEKTCSIENSDEKDSSKQCFKSSEGGGGTEKDIRIGSCSTLQNDIDLTNIVIKQEPVSPPPSPQPIGNDTNVMPSLSDNFTVKQESVSPPTSPQPMDSNKNAMQNVLDLCTIKQEPDSLRHSPKQNKNKGGNSKNRIKTSSTIVKKEPQSERCSKMVGLMSPPRGPAPKRKRSITRERTDSVHSISSEEYDFEYEDEDEEMDQTEEIEDEMTAEQFLQSHGIGSQNFSLDIEVPTDTINIQETEDNTDLLHNLWDLTSLLGKTYVPKVNGWVQSLTKLGAKQENVKSALNLKEKMVAVKDRVCKLQIQRAAKESSTTRENEAGESDSDDDFEEVKEKEGYEETVPDMDEIMGSLGGESNSQGKKTTKASTSKDWALPSTSKEMVQDPTTWESTITMLKKNLEADKLSSSKSSTVSSSSQDKGSSKYLNSRSPKIAPKNIKREKEIEKAPVLPFGTDLYHWGEKAEIPLLVRYDSEHRFWCPKDNDDVVDQSALDSMNARMINFTGQFTPVKWKCRAPLPNGKLCERMDRYKCPFHGKVVGRDETGKPTNPADVQRIKEEAAESGKDPVPDWQDPEFIADIAAATGVDLSKPKKGNKGKKRKFSDLTDIKKVENTSRTRLEKKILSKAALKRVNTALDQMNSKKLNDKFGNNFNYSFTK